MSTKNETVYQKVTRLKYLKAEEQLIIEVYHKVIEELNKTKVEEMFLKSLKNRTLATSGTEGEERHLPTFVLPPNIRKLTETGTGIRDNLPKISEVKAASNLKPFNKENNDTEMVKLDLNLTKTPFRDSFAVEEESDDE